MTGYADELRRIRSLQLVATLQKRPDVKARQLIEGFTDALEWQPLEALLIEPSVWSHVLEHFDPKFILCHPDVLLRYPVTSLYYRGLCGLPLKTAKSYFGALEKLEAGSPRARLDYAKALKMARTYNTFLCSIIKNSSDWTLDNGYRTIIATLGITVDGSSRNKAGRVAEVRVRDMLLLRLAERGLIVEPEVLPEQIAIPDALPRLFVLKKDIQMRFGSEPDVSFRKDDQYLAVLEIKGGIDPAGALERYGAARKTFENVVQQSPRCDTFLLTAVETKEFSARLHTDRLVRHLYDIIRLIEDPGYRDKFFDELFNHVLRLTS